MVNKRLLELAERQKTNSFLEDERRKEEEIRNLKEGEKRKARQEIVDQRKSLLDKLDADKQKKEKFKLYIDNLNNYEGGRVDEAIYAFVNHPDFAVIYNQLNTLPTQNDKWGFLLRRAYEIGNEINLPLGNEFTGNSISVKRKLEDYGIYSLCPYFRENENPVTSEECLIDGEPFMSSCRGMYEQCVIFQEMAGKAVTGEVNLPKTQRASPKIKIPEIDVKPVDINDLNDWWKMEGKYE